MISAHFTIEQSDRVVESNSSDSKSRQTADSVSCRGPKEAKGEVLLERVSQYFKLGRNQGSLDFVDIDVRADVPVYVDPRAVRTQRGDWGESCRELLVSFFAEVLDAIHRGNDAALATLMRPLSEPNETHLGESRGPRSRGRGLGPGGADEIADALSKSLAAKTGLLEDLEDTSLMVKGIGRDILSDMTTGILRGALIGYTQRCAEYYQIPTESQYSGNVWNPNTLEWQSGMAELPRGPEGTLLLVPRSIVRLRMTFDKGKYYNGYLAPYLEEQEFQSNSDLVRTLRNGQRKINRTDLRKKYPEDKLSIVKYTLEFPDALSRYRKSDTSLSAPPLDHNSMAEATKCDPPNFIDLVEAVEAISPGRAGATAYHRAVEALLTAVFYPSLGNMTIEDEIHSGRKRIDIRYDNLASVGFFYWLALNHRAPTIAVECKNYTGEVGNPELDQLSGRLSPHRGQDHW